MLVCGLGLLLLTQAAQEVNLYSARKEALIKPLLDQFTKKTGYYSQSSYRQSRCLIKTLTKRR